MGEEDWGHAGSATDCVILFARRQDLRTPGNGAPLKRNNKLLEQQWETCFEWLSELLVLTVPKFVTSVIS